MADVATEAPAAPPPAGAAGTAAAAAAPAPPPLADADLARLAAALARTRLSEITAAQQDVVSLQVRAGVCVWVCVCMGRDGGMVRRA